LPPPSRPASNTKRPSGRYAGAKPKTAGALHAASDVYESLRAAVREPMVVGAVLAAAVFLLLCACVQFRRQVRVWQRGSYVTMSD
jgi:uncharacterized protein (DUF2062 family)